MSYRLEFTMQRSGSGNDGQRSHEDDNSKKRDEDRSRRSRFPKGPAIAVIAVASALAVGGRPTTKAPPPDEPTGWPVTGSGQADALMIPVTLGEPPPPGTNCGMIGCGGYYSGEMRFSPDFEFPGDGTIHVTVTGTAKEFQRQDPGGLAAVSWSLDTQCLGYPALAVKSVKAVFDTGAVTANTAEFRLQIPRRARRLLEMDVNWVCANRTQLLVFRGGPMQPAPQI